jgi:dephospho-CoA kinase
MGVIVGLTGGIGSGKSEASRMLAARGAVVVDADSIAREVVELGTVGLERLVSEFGPQILAADGSLDRAAMASRVFADPEARERLEAVIHPLVAQRSADVVNAAPDEAVVVYDVPLLVENSIRGFDLVVVVDAPDDVRLDRLTRLRGMEPGDARARMAAQATRDERLSSADVVLDNSGSLADLERQVDALWVRLSQT